MTNSGERYESGAVPLEQIGETLDFTVGKLGIHLAWESFTDGPVINKAEGRNLALIPTVHPDLMFRTTWWRPSYEGKAALSVVTKIQATGTDASLPDKEVFVDALSELAKDNGMNLKDSMFSNIRYITERGGVGRHIAQIGYYDTHMVVTNDVPIQYRSDSRGYGPGTNFRPTPIDRIQDNWGDQRHYISKHLTIGAMSLMVITEIMSGRGVTSTEFIVSPGGTFYFDQELQLCIPLTSAYDLTGLPHEQHTAEDETITKEAVSISEDIDLNESEEVVELSDFAGLEHITSQLRDVARSFKHPEIMKKYRAKRPNGILFHGQAGTGKSMLARALAHEIGGELWEIKVSGLIDQMLGGSQKNMQNIFDKAAKITTPTVMLWDEIDAMLGKNQGTSSASREVNSMIGVFKTEMANLIDKNPNIIVAATTNKPELLDDAVVRAGRFDLKLDIPLPVESARLRIWTNKITEDIASTGTHLNPDRFHPDTSSEQIKDFNLYADDIDIPALARATDEMSGSDIVECLRRTRFECAMHEVRTGEPQQITQQLLIDTIRTYYRS